MGLLFKRSKSTRRKNYTPKKSTDVDAPTSDSSHGSHDSHEQSQDEQLAQKLRRNQHERSVQIVTPPGVSYRSDSTSAADSAATGVHHGPLHHHHEDDCAPQASPKLTVQTNTKRRTRFWKKHHHLGPDDFTAAAESDEPTELTNESGQQQLFCQEPRAVPYRTFHFYWGLQPSLIVYSIIATAIVFRNPLILHGITALLVLAMAERLMVWTVYFSHSRDIKKFTTTTTWLLHFWIHQAESTLQGNSVRGIMAGCSMKFWNHAGKSFFFHVWRSHMEGINMRNSKEAENLMAVMDKFRSMVTAERPRMWHFPKPFQPPSWVGRSASSTDM